MSDAPRDDLEPAWAPPPRPARAAVHGKTVSLDPLDPGKHATDLFTASRQAPGDERLWDYMPYGPFADQRAFGDFVEAAARSSDPLFFALVDAAARPFGMASYQRITPQHGVIEIGDIWFGPAAQRSRQGTEAILVLARHAFDELGYRRLEWKCNALNERSRRAAARFGFRFEGVFRQHMVVKGRNRDTAWFSVIDGEWPAVRAAFERWLDPSNFDDQGRQRQSLAALRAAGGGSRR